MREQGLWSWHMLSGMVVLVLLGLHMGIMHLDATLGLVYSPAGGHPIDWPNVVARAKSASFAFSYVLLLGTALVHGLYGLRNIIFELGPSSATKKAVSWLLLTAGLALFVLGTWAAWASFKLAQTV